MASSPVRMAQSDYRNLYRALGETAEALGASLASTLIEQGANSLLQ